MSTCDVDRPVHASDPPPKSEAQRKSNPPYWISIAMERSFSSDTETLPPPMILPLRAMHVAIAPLPSGICVPTGITVIAPAVVVNAAAANPSLQEEAYEEPL